MSIYTYAPDQVDIFVALSRISGFMENSLISLDQANTYTTTKRRADGFISRTVHKTDLFSLKISLMQTSESNDTLALIMNTDRVLGDSIVPIYIKDSNSGTIIMALNAWIDKQPSIVYNKGIEGREWMLTIAEPIIVNSGGSNDSVFESFMKIAQGGLANFS